MERTRASQAWRRGLAESQLDGILEAWWRRWTRTVRTIVSVPKVEGRIRHGHFLNGWGETMPAINERLFPSGRSKNRHVPPWRKHRDRERQFPVKYSPASSNSAPIRTRQFA